MPPAASAFLIGLVIILGTGMLVVGTGMATSALGGLGSAFADAMSQISVQASGAHSSPTPDLTVPAFDAPENGGYTNEARVTLTGSVPSTAVGKTGYSVRIYSIQANGQRLRYQDVPVGGTVRFAIQNVTLSPGTNTFVARLVAPSGESGDSPSVVYTFDTTVPKIAISSPANDATITATSVTVSGKTEPKSSISITNVQSSGVASAKAGDDGTFHATVSLAAGDNTLTITATDRAGNTSTTNLKVHRSLGKLSASLTASPASVPTQSTTNLVLSARATASDGSPLAGASVDFTVAITGLAPIESGTLTANAAGEVSWTTKIQDAKPGPAFATVVFTTDRDGDVTATAQINVVGQ